PAARRALSPWPRPLIALISMPKGSALQIALVASNLTPEPGVRGSARNASGIANAPIGTPTPNSHGQWATDRMPAATVGPAADAIEPIVAFSPTPRPRWLRG